MGCLVAVVLLILAFVTIPLPPIAIIFLGLAILSAIKAMGGDKKDGTFSERWGREIEHSFSGFGCFGLVVALVMVLIIIFIASQ